MSVRKSAARTSARDLSGGAQALKSFGVWALLAAASFVVGLFILSPLINVAAGSRSAGPSASAQPAPAPSHQPAPATSTPTLTVPQRSDRPVDSDVGISVEKPRPAENPEVQAPQGLDQGATGRTDESDTQALGTGREDRSSRHRRGSEENASPSDRTTDSAAAPTDRVHEGEATRSSRQERTERSEGPQPTESLDQSRRSDRAADATGDTKARRNRRPSRPSGEDKKSPTRESNPQPAGSGDIQKGDNIDR
jgi:hypothetical protein